MQSICFLIVQKSIALNISLILVLQPWKLYLDVVRRLVNSNEPESYAGRSLTPARATPVIQVKGYRVGTRQKAIH